MTNINKQYVGFSREEFELKLKGIQYLLGWNDFKDVTDQLSSNGKLMWERIYEFQVDNIYVRIYSTVDTRTNLTRDSGNDKVKIISVLKSSESEKYFLLSKHVRIISLFDNIKKSLSRLNSSFNSEDEYVENLIDVLM